MKILILLLLTASSFGATYYLDASATGAGDGSSWTDAWTTIAQAQSVLVALDDNGSGDTVLVRDGSYGSYGESGYNEGTVDTRTDWLTFQADTGHTPVLTYISIDNQNGPYDVYLAFDGFTIQPAATRAACVDVRSSNYFKLLNCNIIGLGNDTVTATTYGLRAWGAPDHVTVDGCTFSGGDNTGRFDGFAYGIYAIDGDNLVFTDNEIKQFRLTGIETSGNINTITGNNIHQIGGDGITIGGGDGPVLIEDNEIHDLYIYTPDLTETPTDTTWSVDGLTMTNASATWGADAPFSWEGNVEIRVNSGTNVNTGDNEVVVGTVVSPTEILLSKTIKDDPGGATPSNVDYYFISVTHGDLIQVYATSNSSNVTIRGNQLYDCYGQIAWLNPLNSSNQPSGIGGHDWIFENNLCWNDYADGQAEYNGTVYIGHVDGVVVRNNTVIGRLDFSDSTGIQLHSNIVGYITGGTFTSNDYNIINRGWITAGINTTFIHPNAYAWDDWDDPVFTGIFTDYPTDLTHASAISTGVGHGDPANSTATDILGNSRDADPDAGAYEYINPTRYLLGSQ